MRCLLRLNAICFLFLISACASNKELAKKSVFSFYSDGNEYQIISINTKSGEGTNLLSRMDTDGRQLSIARDLDQDGSIDLILNRELSINEANIIYTLGIDKAKEAGNYVERISLRTFEYIEEKTVYTIKTYLIDRENANNLFLIFNKELNTESIFLDTNADGILNSVEKGNISLNEAGDYYRKVLKAGVQARKIELREESFWVKELNMLESATALK